MDEERADRVHTQTLTIDSHIDVLGQWASGEIDPGEDGDTQVDIPKMREGGIDAAMFVMFAPQLQRDEAGYARMWQTARTAFDGVKRMADSYPDDVTLVASPGQVSEVHNAGKIAACIAVENGGIIGQDLTKLEALVACGASYITLCHNGHNDICDSARPWPKQAEVEHGGVSAFGREVIAEMNRLGIMVDVSHTSIDSTRQAAELSKAPIIASHSCCRALVDTPRNLSDDQLKLIQDSGGVVQVTALESLVRPEDPRYRERMAAISQRFGLDGDVDPDALPPETIQAINDAVDALDEELGKASVKHFVDHIEYAIDKTDINTVGIGSDFHGGGMLLYWEDVSQSANITYELLSRGYSESDIAAIWGGNLLRVWNDVRAAAER